MAFRKWRTVASFCGELGAVIHCAVQRAGFWAEASETMAMTKRAESLLGTREIGHLTERGREEDFAAWPGLESPDAHATRSAC